MRIWILCANQTGAEIFLKKTPVDEPCLCRTIPYKKNSKSKRKKVQDFIQYVNEEMEIACGAGTDARLIVCAKKKLLTNFKKHLSDQVRDAIIETFEMDSYPGAKTLAC
jgi:hypothetical protein